MTEQKFKKCARSKSRETQKKKRRMKKVHRNARLENLAWA
jgi:hypothetical protein